MYIVYLTPGGGGTIHIGLYVDDFFYFIESNAAEEQFITSLL